MELITLNTSLYPVIILEYNIKKLSSNFIEKYNLVSEELKDLKPLDKKYFLIHNLVKINLNITNIYHFKNYIKPILEKANYVAERVTINCVVLSENISKYIKLLIPFCLNFSPVKTKIFYKLDSAINYCNNI